MVVAHGIQIIKLGYDNTTQIPFSITSNNANSSYAKAGDTVSIQITVNASKQEHSANSKLEYECGSKWSKYDKRISYNSSR